MLEIIYVFETDGKLMEGVCVGDIGEGVGG